MDLDDEMGKMGGNNSRSDVPDWVFSHISLHK